MNKKNRKDILSAQIKEYIDSHLSDAITVSDLCGRFHISKTALYNLSIRNFNMGIKEYIRSARIQKAKQMLLNTPEKSIQDIAKETGFKDCNYFTRYFGKTEGMTPSSFRKNGTAKF